MYASVRSHVHACVCMQSCLNSSGIQLPLWLHQTRRLRRRACHVGTNSESARLLK